jgi:hypothetical protein
VELPCGSRWHPKARPGPGHTQQVGLTQTSASENKPSAYRLEGRPRTLLPSEVSTARPLSAPRQVCSDCGTNPGLRNLCPICRVPVKQRILLYS